MPRCLRVGTESRGIDGVGCCSFSLRYDKEASMAKPGEGLVL